MIKSRIFLSFILLESILLAALLLHGQVRLHTNSYALLGAKKMLVSTLGLTDFSIWTEARYTRHPSQADFFSAFQDFPGSLEHFPAGTILLPPQLFQGDEE